jgi:hypothetical protein
LAAYGAGGIRLEPRTGENELLDLALKADVATGKARMALLSKLKKEAARHRSEWILSDGVSLSA